MRVTEGGRSGTFRTVSPAPCAAQAIVEKASIDEVYVDVTAIVDAQLRRPPDDGDRGAAQAAHSSQDDGEAEAEAEAHGATRSAAARPSGINVGLKGRPGATCCIHVAVYEARTPLSVR